jgi:hypothetical protein
MMKLVLISALMLGLGACSEAPEDTSETSTALAVPKALELRRTARTKAMAESYAASISFKDQYNALDPRLKRSGVTRGSSFDANDDYWGLPRTEGYEEVAAYCSACHSLAIVMQQHVTPERWEYLLKWMVEKQGMPALDPNEHALVKAYLIKNFSSTP